MDREVPGHSEAHWSVPTKNPLAGVTWARSVAGGDLSGRRGAVQPRLRLAGPVFRLRLPTAGWPCSHTRRPTAHVLRSMSQFTSQTLLLIAFSMMPLASATAINFSAPLFAALASLVFLKEPVGTARWAALVVGFVGVLIVTNPGSETFQIGALYRARQFLAVRHRDRGRPRHDHDRIGQDADHVPVDVAFDLLRPDAAVLFRHAVLGRHAADRRQRRLTNMLGQYWWTRSIHLAPTSAVVPFQYLSLIWAMGFGFALWGDVPTIGLIIGSAIVVGSGLFLLWHESRPKMTKLGPP